MYQLGDTLAYTYMYTMLLLVAYDPVYKVFNYEYIEYTYTKTKHSDEFFLTPDPDTVDFVGRVWPGGDQDQLIHVCHVVIGCLWPRL